MFDFSKAIPHTLSKKTELKTLKSKLKKLEEEIEILEIQEMENKMLLRVKKRLDKLGVPNELESGILKVFHMEITAYDSGYKVGDYYNYGSLSNVLTILKNNWKVKKFLKHNLGELNNG